jgi:Caspase domain
MTLLYDSGADHQSVPAVHALIIGVSSYPNLEGGPTPQPETYGMGQLDSAATSAWRVYEGLRARDQLGQLARPLGTCRVLLSPSAAEAAALPPLTRQAVRATAGDVDAALAAWRETLRHQKDAVAFFYFVGHGIQWGNEATMLLEEFNQAAGKRLRNAVSTANVYEGVSPTQQQNQNIARTQLFFVDACRFDPERFQGLRREEAQVGFSLTQGVAAPDDRNAPLFYATLQGVGAMALADGQSYFSQALLSALDLAVADPEEVAPDQLRWPVTVATLEVALRYAMEQVLRGNGGSQQVVSDGAMVGDAVIQYLRSPPQIPVTIQVEPSAAAAGRLQLEDGGGLVVSPTPVSPIHPLPFRVTLPLGSYTVIIDAPPLRRRVIQTVGFAYNRRNWSVRAV